MPSEIYHLDAEKLKYPADQIQMIRDWRVIVIYAQSFSMYFNSKLFNPHFTNRNWQKTSVKKKEQKKNTVTYSFKKKTK